MVDSVSETLNKTMQVPAGSFEWKKTTLFVSECRRQGDMPEVTDANCDVGILPGTFRVLQIIDADKMLLSHLDSHGFADKTILVYGLKTVNSFTRNQKPIPNTAQSHGRSEFVENRKLGLQSFNCMADACQSRRC